MKTYIQIQIFVKFLPHENKALFSTFVRYVYCTGREDEEGPS